MASLQFRVLRIGLLQDEDVRVGVLPEGKKIRASSEDVVASASGTSNLCTVARDSPSSLRSFVAASPSASSTFSLETAVTCSSASASPLSQLTAFSSSTYLLPRLPIA